MKKKQRIAVLVAIALAVPGVGNWNRQAADAMTADTAQSSAADITESTNQAELYHKVYKENTAGHISYSLEDDTGDTLSRYTSSAVAKNKRSMALPASYDPRGTEQETPIRNQQDTGACWAFGALKALESDCLMKGILTKDTADLSENHLAWYAYHALDDTTSPLYGDHMSHDYVSDRASYNKGGNADVAQAVLANKWGAVAESEAPFDTASNMASVMKNAASSLRTQSLIQLTDSECYDPYLASDTTARNEIKEAILTHGAMDVALYFDTSSCYYKESNGVYASYAYMVGSDRANHCVTIVGWDDDFNNFSKDAPESGAWLIANSYGTNYSKDENGYFWVSYYDSSLCEYYTFEGVSADTYQTIFQYDGNGWNNSLRSPEEMKTANVFTADGSQQLQAVAFYTVQENQPYTVDIYRSVSGKDPTNGTQIKEASVSGNFAKTGYHTVQLPKEVRVADGEKFSVVITYATVDDSACVPLEGQNDPQNGYCYSSSAGQSYTYFAEDAKWYDNTAISVDGVQYDLNNACIKVFGNPADEPVATLTPTATPTVAPAVLPTTNPLTSSTPTSTAHPSTSSTPTSTTNPSTSGTPTSTANPSTSSTPTSTTNPSTPGTPTSTAAPSDATEQPKRTVSPNAGGRYQTKIKAKAKYTIGKGEKITLPVTVTGGSVQAAVKWTSSNTKVAKVTNKGVVKGCKRGTAKIVMQTVDGKKKTIRVTVKKAPKKIKLTAQKAKIKKGKVLQTRTILSKGSASYKLRFVSSNKRIATVNSAGKIKAKRRGTVRIYVYTYNNKKSQIKIKIV